MRFARLLNPVEVSKFLVWNTLSECPPRLRNDSLNADGLVTESVARSREAAMRSVKRLRRDGFLRNSLCGKPSSYSLSSKGVELIEQFEEAWEIIRHENPKFFH